MPVLDAKGLRRTLGPQTLLDGVDLTILRGERVGLVGRNGSGKSTLARILAGVEAPEEGALTLRRGAQVGLLPQLPRFAPGSTIRAVVRGGLAAWSAAKARYDETTQALAELRAGDEQTSPLLARQSELAATLERLGGWQVEHRVETLIGQLGLAELDLDGPVDRLSGGEQRRVDLARVLIAAPDLAILDEPTNHLDLAMIEWLEQHLSQSFAGALLLITHDRALLDQLAQRTLELDRGRLLSHPGGYRAFVEAKAERLEQEARVEANRARYLRHELAWLRRQPKARTGKQKARQQRIEAAVADRPAAAEGQVALRATAGRSGKSILDAEGLRVAIGERVLVDGLTLTLQRGQRFGILGPSGCGKTTLLRTLIGEREPQGGTLVRGKNTRVGYLSQLRAALDPERSVRDNVADDRDHLVIGERGVDVFSYLARFLFVGPALDQPVSALSGGERTRVALALLLSQPANLLVLDEPTNDLDVQTIGALEQMLLEFAGTALIVSHDRWFLERVASEILAFEGGGVVTHYPGSYSTYRALRDAAQRARREEQRAVERPPRRPSSPKRPQGLTYAERLELQQIEARIEQAEATVRALETRLADPALYQRPDGHQQATRLDAELGTARAEVETLTARWEALELKREEVSK